MTNRLATPQPRTLSSRGSEQSMTLLLNHLKHLPYPHQEVSPSQPPHYS